MTKLAVWWKFRFQEFNENSHFLLYFAMVGNPIRPAVWRRQLFIGRVYLNKCLVGLEGMRLQIEDAHACG
jgi:hypothetical protein